MKRAFPFLLCLLLLTAATLTRPAATVRAENSDFPTDTANVLLAAFDAIAHGDMRREAGEVAVSIASDDSQASWDKATDHSQWSYLLLKNGATLTVSARQNFDSLYLMFEIPCQWSITLPSGRTLEGGKNGFIHEYMPLSESCASVTLTLPPQTRLTDIYAFSGGRPPAWVQRWQPPCEDADLLVMPTHADDEYLWFGGALPYFAGEAGYEVQVVYLTDHFDKTVRNHERLNGLWTVGVTRYPVIGPFPDKLATKRSMNAAAEIFGYDNVLAFQVEMLRRFSPEVVIAHDINGEYGHGAHKLNAATLLEALPLTDDPAAYPASAAAYGTCKVQKCYLHLWRERRITINWEKIPLERFGGKTAYQMACEGYACHQSQLRFYSMERDAAKYDCGKFGLAYTSVGDDSTGVGDMFEHVVWQ